MNGAPSGRRKVPGRSRCRTDVPTAMNSTCSGLSPCWRKDSCTPTTPSACTCAASDSIRPIALARAVYIACVRTPSSTDWRRFCCCQPMWKTELPMTNSSGSNPAASSRANSLTDRSLVQTLPASASRAEAI